MRVFEKQPDKAAALQAVRDHIRDEVSQTRGYVSEWDVINEPFDNHDLMDAYGKNVMVDWFNEAHKAAPQAHLTLNDYGILTSQTDTAHEQHFEDIARYLLQNGAPLTMLGMQGHFGDTPPTPTCVYQLLNRYAKTGVPIRITEYTMDTDDESLRADWTRDFLTILYSHPNVVGWQCWTFEDLFDTKTGRAKPAGQALQTLARKWRTDLTLSSAKTGDVRGVGYRGTYRISVTQAGRTVSKIVALAPGAAPIMLVLPSRMMKSFRSFSTASIALAAFFCFVAAPGQAQAPPVSETSEFPVVSGAFKPDWESLAQYRCPEWFRDAKFGIWAHWTAQSVPEQGDWCARRMYEENEADYQYHIAHYGPQSQVGFKDIDRLWKAEKWKPDALMDLYAPRWDWAGGLMNGLGFARFTRLRSAARDVLLDLLVAGLTFRRFRT